jgi:hypothetical protein
MRCPHLSTISIRPNASPGHIGDSGGSLVVACSGSDAELFAGTSSATTAGANLLASAAPPRRPSRSSRRQLNNWLADRPFRRAVADTGPL